MLHVGFLHEARLELIEAALWYEERVPYLGDEFLEEIERVIGIITQFPEAFPAYEGPTRRALLRRFPFMIVYRFFLNRIEIVAVAHMQRDSLYWADRLKK